MKTILGMFLDGGTANYVHKVYVNFESCFGPVVIPVEW